MLCDAMRCLSRRNIVATVARNQIEHRNIDDGSKLIEWSDECDCLNRIKVKRHDDEQQQQKQPQKIVCRFSQ